MIFLKYRKPFVAGSLVCALFIACGAGGDNEDGGFVYPDGLIAPDIPDMEPDLQSDVKPPVFDVAGLDIVTNSEGPQIKIIKPATDETIVGDILEVHALITDPDFVKAQSVFLFVNGGGAVPMNIDTSTPDLYTAVVDISEITSNVELKIKAQDLGGEENEYGQEFKRDPGPFVQFLAPSANSRFKTSVTAIIAVSDPGEITDFEVKLGQKEISLTEKKLSDKQFVYSGTVEFDDPIFVTPLSGEQVIVAKAVNANGAESTAQLTFFVDNEGPSIIPDGLNAGDLVGNLLKLKATVEDPAGILPSSVRVVIGNELDNREVQLETSGIGGTEYTGQIDTKTLSPKHVWPVVSFRATDTLGNESHVDFEVGLDNGAPIIELDPPTDYYWWRFDKALPKEKECSHSFDPVGGDAPNDLDTVGQFTRFRARVEDSGNSPWSNYWVPIGGVQQGKVWLYVLDDTTQPLVVDSDADGFCDMINPNVIPVGSAPLPHQAVAVNLDAIGPGGASNFVPYLELDEGPFPWCYGGDRVVEDEILKFPEKPPKAPETMCSATGLTQVTYYTPAVWPSIYAIPPFDGDGKCHGLPFDFAANNINEDWVCAAVSAPDILGNQGVSKPIRLYVGFTSIPNPPPNSEPNCTGTMDPLSGDVSNAPCTFRPVDDDFPQVYPETEWIEGL